MIIKRIGNYLLLLILITVASYFIQEWVYNTINGTWASEKFYVEYVFNFSLALLMGILFMIISKRSPGQLGNAYLAGIAIKFILFFIVIYPAVTADGHASRMEFANFFVPFLVCLLTELFFLIRLLKN